MFLSAPTLPFTPGMHLSGCLRLTDIHNNTLPWLGTVTVGYLLTLTRALGPSGRS